MSAKQMFYHLQESIIRFHFFHYEAEIQDLYPVLVYLLLRYQPQCLPRETRSLHQQVQASQMKKPCYCNRNNF